MTDHPETDEQGRLRAIVEPGRQRFSVGTVPPGWKLEGSPGKPVILVAGREMTIRWQFTRVDEPKAAAESGPALFPDDLVETWRRQDRRALPGKFRIRHYSYYVGGDPIPPDELEAFLDANDLGKVADPAAALEDRFPQMPEAQPAFYEIVDDGRNRRNTFGFDSKTRTNNILVFNGYEVVRYDGSNGQSDLFDLKSGGSFKVFGLRDICAWPFRPGTRAADEQGPAGRVRRPADGRAGAAESLTERWVVDRKTGFVHADSMR